MRLIALETKKEMIWGTTSSLPPQVYFSPQEGSWNFCLAERCRAYGRKRSRGTGGPFDKPSKGYKFSLLTSCWDFISPASILAAWPRLKRCKTYTRTSWWSESSLTLNPTDLFMFIVQETFTFTFSSWPLHLRLQLLVLGSQSNVADLLQMHCKNNCNDSSAK